MMKTKKMTMIAMAADLAAGQSSTSSFAGAGHFDVDYEAL